MIDNISVKDIAKKDDRTLSIAWSDGRTDALDVVRLRQECPCAVCIDEMTRERKLRPEDVPETVRPLKVESVGQYAMSIRFNDGHGTGIYTYQMLRDLADQTKH